MAIDRDETLRKAEKLLRQGKLEAAIAEYARVVEDQPRDWVTANLLGDLFVRSGQIERAVAQYTRIADHLASDGFLSKAAALYKKIIKIHPDDDTALMRAADLAAQQGLVADARGYLAPLLQHRLRRGDRAGAARAAARLAELDPGNPVGRLEAARLLAEMGESIAAGEQLRAAGVGLRHAGKAAEGLRAWKEALRFNPADDETRGLIVAAHLELGDPDAAREAARTAKDLVAVAAAFSRVGREAEALSALEAALAADPGADAARVAAVQTALRLDEGARAERLMAPLAASQSPSVQLLRAELELRAGRYDTAGEILDQCLASGEDLLGALGDLAGSLVASNPDAAFAVVGAILRRADATADVETAIATLERFSAAAPTHVEALEYLVKVCDGPFHEDHQYRARVRLADAYLAQRRWADARSTCEVLVAQRPEHEPHRERLARAMDGLGIAAVAPPAAGADPVVLASSEMLDFLASLPARPPTEEPDLKAELVPPAAPEVPLGLELEEPARPEAFEIDLSAELEDLLAEIAPAPQPIGEPLAPPPEAAADADTDDGLELDGVFREMREAAGRDAEAAAAARAYDRASECFNQGERAAAAAHLREAVRDVAYRFRAASMLARFAREDGNLEQAVEWLERAAEAPAPTLQASHALLYDLADTLEAAGEPSRALAVFLELSASAPSYRDVAARVADLSAPQTGRTGPWRERA